MKKITFISLIAAVTLTACGNDGKQNEQAIKQAIENYNATHPLCMAVIPAVESGVTNVLGSDLVRFVKMDGNGKRVNTQAVKQMSVLTNAGLYKKRKDEKSPEIGKKAWVSVYELTEKGKKFTQGEMGNRELCVGSLSVQKVEWFSEPTADNGLTISRVSYQGKYRLHKWAEKALSLGNASVYKNLSQPTTQQAAVVKTNKGWIDIREVKNSEQ
ncbi:MAG: hypothetical protein IKX14_03450 [Neisseriaceae bacterium]|nr:hypothetical protein [Neisseriaceae bacterium]